MKYLTYIASIIIEHPGAIGAILSCAVSLIWSRASLDAKEDIIRQKEEKIRHLKEDRDELLRIKDEQIKLLELQLKVQRNQLRSGRKKSKVVAE